MSKTLVRGAPNAFAGRVQLMQSSFQHRRRLLGRLDHGVHVLRIQRQVVGPLKLMAPLNRCRVCGSVPTMYRYRGNLEQVTLKDLFTSRGNSCLAF